MVSLKKLIMVPGIKYHDIKVEVDNSFGPRVKNPIGWIPGNFDFLLHSTSSQAEILHLRQDYRHKYGTYIDLERIRSGDSKDVAIISPKLAIDDLALIILVLLKVKAGELD